MADGEPPALVLDFDGVLTSSADAGGRLIDRALIRRLTGLGLPVQWLTMNAFATMRTGIGAPSAGSHTGYPRSTWETTSRNWWKLQVMRARPPAPFVWVDDRLARCPDARRWAGGLLYPSLLIAPDPRVGLTGDDLDRIETFAVEITTVTAAEITPVAV